MKKRSLWISAAASLLVAAVLAGCGSTTYFAGRVLPPSGLKYRVMIAVQNLSTLSQGGLEIVDAYYDIRSSHDGKTSSFSISGYSGALPVTIQNMPEEQFGAVYGSGDGSFAFINYQKESGLSSGLSAKSTSVYTTRDQRFIFSATGTSDVLTILDQSGVNAGTYYMSLPGVYKVSLNPGGSVALVFQKNTNYVYYPIKLNSSEQLLAAKGTSYWPAAAVDCQPTALPVWCLMQAQNPTTLDANYNGLNGLQAFYYGTPLVFDRPRKALFSSDGATAYVLNCGAECGGTTSSISLLPTASMIFTVSQASGKLPTQSSITTIAVPGGANNALISDSTMYVVGNALSTASGSKALSSSGSLWGGWLTLVNLSTKTAGSPISISDGTPGTASRMILGDDNKLFIGMIQCTNGPNYALGTYGCLTMYNTSTAVAKQLTYQGDATGLAAVTGLHKLYTAEGGQVYIHSTVDGSSIDNEYVTVTGTAYDVVYMDGTSDANNTVY